ncbi:MAG TPA: cytochrome b/b6 domain-containing protein, partial [Anaerolineales bacterium]|nr:cytochrome b/b6 domain-containing protein [Anaerolineales bacterium]
MSETAPKRYHPVFVAIHWLMAVLILFIIAAGKFMLPGIPDSDPQKAMMLQFHAVSGGLIAVLLIVRLVMRLTVKRPDPADAGNAFLNRIARATHFLLYFLVFGMVASGLGIFQSANLPAVFSGAQSYPADLFVYPPRMGHGLVSWLLVALIAL